MKLAGKKGKVTVHILSVSKDSAKIINTQFLDFTTSEVHYHNYEWIINASNPSLFDDKNYPIFLLDLKGRKIIVKDKSDKKKKKDDKLSMEQIDDGKITFDKTSDYNDAEMDGLLLGNKIIKHLAEASMPKNMQKKKWTFNEILVYISLFTIGLSIGLGFNLIISALSGG